MNSVVVTWSVSRAVVGDSGRELERDQRAGARRTAAANARGARRLVQSDSDPRQEPRLSVHAASAQRRQQPVSNAAAYQS